MKIRFRVNKRINLYITLLSCAACIWMMVVRFDVSFDELVSILLYCVGLFVVLAIIALPLGWLIRQINARNDDL